MKKYDLPENLDLNNKEFKTLWKIITTTNKSVFLTGRAGTGKSTFLKYICAKTNKKYVVLAPTGIAAVNVGGMTLHSFFKIPFKPLLPDDPQYQNKTIQKTLNYNREKIKMLRALDLIIIDEISMVRADIIDFIDKVLRYYCRNMREPFGGKQILFVGDVFQLEPVVTPDMREILRNYYRQFFFFNARAFNELSLIPIELLKIYRQNNTEFVSMLDRIRIDKATQQDLEKLGTRVDLNYQAPTSELVITLAARRDIVDSINDERMSSLTTPEFLFEGKIKDDFPEQNLPTSKELLLKEDAQVIFVKNDHQQRWVNGTLGKIVHLDEDNISVELEGGNIYSIEPEIWGNVKYTYDEKKREVKEIILGTFTQYPIKPAWALTVHKSQGLTFNNVIINLKGGAFACGQTYVALSRCTSLEGLILRQNIRLNDILVNPAVIEFSHKFNDSFAITNALNEAEAHKYYLESLNCFKNEKFNDAF